MKLFLISLLLFSFPLSCDDDPPQGDLRPVCGDGRVEAPETCDGTDLQGATCQTEGYVSGALVCAADCTLDTAECNAEDPCAQVADPCPANGRTRCDAGALSTCSADVQGCLSWGSAAPCDTGVCAGPEACAIEVTPVGPIWFLHVSDMHFGKGTTVNANTVYLLGTVLPAISPVATFVTGDQVDDGADTGYWEAYRTAWTGLASAPSYLEVAGNHDVKGDGEQHWITHSPTGAWDPTLFGVNTYETAAGLVEVVRTNTSASSVNMQNTNGYFDEEQADALMGISPIPGAALRVLLAHHPTVGLIPLALGRDRMRAVMAHFGSQIYLCGHAHFDNIDWDGTTLLVQAAEFGEDVSFMLVATDEGGLSARSFPITGPWVMITSPVDPDLGGDNPQARPFSPGSTIPVRAVGTGLREDLTLQVRVENGAWENMTTTRPGVWEADVTLPASAGSCALTVRGSSSEGSSEHEIQVSIQ
jgi:hypothetical protein